MRRDLLELLAQTLLGVPEVIALLEAKPEAGAVAAELAQAYGHLRADTRLAGEDSVERVARDPKLAGSLAH
jgi:hypothetical protein